TVRTPAAFTGICVDPVRAGMRPVPGPRSETSTARRSMMLDTDRRRTNYQRQSGRPDLTPRQRRRLEKKQAAMERRPPRGR
ncbi:MAG TPA: hypothetical protein VHN18_05490, partial [Micromonosporaceae bacterium]|nr:hypothetical protein [Micromonosporaceae bacterium]